MKILILNHDEVVQLLAMTECIEVMSEALSALARGEVSQPLRTILKPAEVKGVLAMMPAFRASDKPMFGLKAICVFPGNAALGKDAHQGGVLIFSGETGEPLALVNASAITSIRTAAVSAVATRSLAREDASELAVIGAGIQARSHLEAMACARSIRRARIASSRFDRARQFTSEMQPRFTFPIEAVETPEAAVRDADLIVTRRSAGLMAMSAPAQAGYPWHPSTNRLVESALSHVAAPQLIGVLMTGMGNDGAAAMARLHELGGATIAESKDTAVVWGMPGELVAAGGADWTEPVHKIATRLLELAPNAADS